jgi:Holliday junction DNA helicase RuvA
MIATLSGLIAEKIDSRVIIDIQGVGYGVLVTSQILDRLQLGDSTKLYIFENIKEDTYDLFGFIRLEDKKLFEQLLGVKNVGPKVAMSVLDIAPSEVVRAAIAGGDVKRLQTAKGVGKRAAEQIVVELRDKMGMLTTDSAEDVVYRSGINQSDEAALALVALGYSESDAALALQKIDPSLSTEERIMRALKG